MVFIWLKHGKASLPCNLLNIEFVTGSGLRTWKYKYALTFNFMVIFFLKLGQFWNNRIIESVTICEGWFVIYLPEAVSLLSIKTFLPFHFSGLPRSAFDNKSVSFEEHIKVEHNMWHYLNFIVLVKVKKSTEFTGPESYVSEMVKVGWYLIFDPQKNGLADLHDFYVCILAMISLIRLRNWRKLQFCLYKW